MARKLVDQEEAAGILGVSVDDLNTMREQQKIYGYRDGGTWKYKEDELERVKREMEEGSFDSSAELDIPLTLEDEGDSILLSESTLGQSASDTSATVIGKSKDNAESDLQLAGDSDLKLESGSDVELSPAESGLRLAGDSDLSLESSGLSLGDSDAKKGGKPGSDLNLGEDDLMLADSVIGSGSGASSGLHLAEEDEEGDVVLGGGPDSDITLTGASDSGISLVDPADSGLSLEEEPAELGGSALGGSNVGMMELGEGDVISLEEDADLDAATQLKSEDDFLLTPLDDAGVDESDSGSQVIALDTDEEFAGAAPSMFAEQPAMLEEDTDEGLGVRTGAAPVGAMAYPSIPEAPYSVWNVTALICCALFLMLGGMMMYDLIRNMWSWDQPYAVNSTIMDGILSLFEK